MILKQIKVYTHGSLLRCLAVASHAWDCLHRVRPAPAVEPNHCAPVIPANGGRAAPQKSNAADLQAGQVLRCPGFVVIEPMVSFREDVTQPDHADCSHVWEHADPTGWRPASVPVVPTGSARRQCILS